MTDKEYWTSVDGLVEGADLVKTDHILPILRRAIFKVRATGAFVYASMKVKDLSTCDPASSADDINRYIEK